MATSLSFSQQVERFEGNEARVDTFVNGSSTTTWTSSGGTVLPSVAKLISDANTQINVAANGILAASQAAAVASQNSAASSAASAVTSLNAADTASAIANRRVDTATALADASILDGWYFSTPSTIVGEAAIIYRKLSGSAIDTGIRIPSAALVMKILPAESGYSFAITDSQQNAVFLVKLDGTVVIPTYDVKISANTTQIAVNTAAIANNSAQLTVLSNLTAQILPPESGYVWALVDSQGFAAILVDKTGQVTMPNFTLPSGSVHLNNLGSDVQAYFPVYLTPESGYSWALVDSQGYIGLGVTTAGALVGNFPGQTLPDASVTESKLSLPLQRQAVPHKTDVIEVRPTEWRAKLGTVAVRTCQDGTLWEPFPHVITQNIKGVNSSGTSLQFRKSMNLLIRGKRYGGTFSITYNSTNSRGTFVDTTTWPPTGTFVAGDYYSYISTISRVIGSNTVYRGDLMVYDGTNWQYQQAPTPVGGLTTARVERDWWASTSSGVFDGVTYSVGDRILFVGAQAGGGPFTERWYKNTVGQGELYYRGEFDPAGGLPSTPSDGELYQASLAGTTGGLTFGVADYLIRDSGVWGLVPSETITVVPNGTYTTIKCTDSSDIEVRRTDKSNTRVGAILGVRKGSLSRRNGDNLRLRSDSMYGVSNIGSLILTKTGRTGDFQSYGGGTSRQVLAMLEYEIARLGDRYAGDVYGFWHGQNNQPSTSNDANSAQIKETSLRMAEIVGARDSRFFFQSVLGTRALTWNGTRFVGTQHEPMFAGTGPLLDIEQWYALMFPGQWVSTRLIQLASAGNTPDLTFPGMTERQVADTYGIVPFSYYLGAASIPIAASLLVFKGYWSTLGLPTGGTANDYYLRTGNGTAGNIILNNAGTWIEPALDLVHQSPVGAESLSTGVANFVNTSLF